MTLQSKPKTSGLRRLILALTLLTIASVGASAQQTNTFPETGNAGVGTTTPAYPLTILSAPTADPFVQGYFKSTSTSFPYGGVAVDGNSQSHIRFMLGGTLKWQWRVGAGTAVDDLRAYNWTLGADVMTLKNNGNVGIGTTNPGNYRLTVSGPFQGAAGYTSYIADGLFGATAVPSRISTYNFNGGILFGYEDLGLGDYSPRVGLQQTFDTTHSPSITTTKASIGLVRNGNITIRGGASHTEFFRIDNSGNVGIGTTNPLAQLHFGTGSNAGLKTYTASDTNHGFLFSSYLDTNSPYRRYGDIVAMSNQDGISGGSTIRFLTNPNNSFTALERMRIDYLGNIGIGTTSPSTKFHISAGDSSFALFGPNVQWGGSLVVGSGNSFLTPISGRAQVLTSNGNLHLDGGTNQSVYIGWLTPTNTIINGQGGTVGINIQYPNSAYKLDVNGEINATGIRINGTPISGGGGSQWSGTSPITYTAGNVGIGTSSPNAKLDVNGNFSVTGGGTNDTVKVLSTSSVSGGTFIQNTQASGQAITLVENNRGSYTSYGALVYGGSNNALGNLFGVSRADKAFLLADGASNLGLGVGTLVAQPLILGTNNAERMRVNSDGKVGIGTTTPEEKLHVAGSIKVDGNINAKYQDLAEWVPSSEQLAAGTVVVLDTTRSNQVISSTVAYDTRVAGVISSQPGITLGESGEGKVLVATTGRVRVKVDASRGAIQIGDLLVTSDVVGVAMKSEAVNLSGVQIHRPGTIIGKALEPLAKGSGEILVLLSLQ